MSNNEIKDRFSLFNHGRKLGANNRKYIVKAVQSVLSSEQTQELLRTGEAFGYYGHQNRQRANKLSVGETEVIMIDGKPVVVENVPSNVTKEIFCDDNGIVTHTERFLDTSTGRIAQSMWNSKAGGWSWATGGRDSSTQAVATSFHGVDYVLQPNYLSVDHPAMMLESLGDDALFESLKNVGGFDEESANNIIQSMSGAISADQVMALEQDKMLLEGMNAELQDQLSSQNQFRSMLLESLERLPFYMTDEQRQAIKSLDKAEDLDVLNAMFESIGSKSRVDSDLLKAASGDNSSSYIKTANKKPLTGEVRFDSSFRRFS